MTTVLAFKVQRSKIRYFLNYTYAIPAAGQQGEVFQGLMEKILVFRLPYIIMINWNSARKARKIHHNLRYEKAAALNSEELA